MKIFKHLLIICGYCVGVVTMIACLFGLFFATRLTPWEAIIAFVVIFTVFTGTRELMFKLGRLQDKIGY